MEYHGIHDVYNGFILYYEGISSYTRFIYDGNSLCIMIVYMMYMMVYHRIQDISDGISLCMRL